MDYEQISYAKTVYGQEEIDAVVKCLNESTQMGNYSRKFENKIAKLFDKKHCLYVNSGSSANLLAIFPISWRLPVSRFPPQPKIRWSLFFVRALKAVSADSRAAGVCA